MDMGEKEIWAKPLDDGELASMKAKIAAAVSALVALVLSCGAYFTWF